MTRDELVAAAGESIRLGSRSFHMASRLFDRETRERAWLLYCWCRHCDDVCDGQSYGQGRFAPSGSNAEVELLTRGALRGDVTLQLPFDALGAVVRECPIPNRYIFDHLRGFALDAQGWRPRDETELLAYCYHVAGTVGCMMAVIMGVDPSDEETLDRACDLGIAFQLANIARDIREDRDSGRCYLPSNWLAEANIDPGDPLRADRRDDLVALVKRLVALAHRFEASARIGVPKLPFRARWAVLAAARIYGAIGRRVSSMGPSAWDRRVVVPRRVKLAYLVPSLADSVRLRGG
ncbi:MAG TPA: phytoene/squalene synthase family protein [Allosphingosinicella sp.]|jgi:phytoene synthase